MIKISIFLDENTPLIELPEAYFPVVPRQGEVICIKNGNEYTVAEVMWSVNECDPAFPILTIIKKHI